MKTHKYINIILSLLAVFSLVFGGISPAPVLAKGQTPPTSTPAPTISGGTGNTHGHVTPAERQAAAVRAAKARAAGLLTPEQMTKAAAPAMNPGGTPDYFGTTPNYANSPIPASVGIAGDGTGASAVATLTLAGAVAGITVTNGGSGYTDAATTATLIGGGGTGAVLNPVIDAGSGAITSINVVSAGTGYNTVPGIRKFVDSLPGLTSAGANDLGQYIPVAAADTSSYPGSGTFGNSNYVPPADYYEIALVDYTEKLHKDLPATLLRGYVQVKPTNSTGTYIPISCNGTTLYEVEAPQYLGPVIVSGSYDPTKPAGTAGNGKPTRIKFHNCLPTGSGGDLFIPVDTTVMGAGEGPKTAGGAACDPDTQVCASTLRTAPPCISTVAIPHGSAMGRRTSGPPRPAKPPPIRKGSVCITFRIWTVAQSRSER